MSMKEIKIIHIITPVLYVEQKFRFRISMMYWLRDHHLVFFARVVRDLIYWRHNSIISIESSIHPSTRFPHAVGIVIGAGVSIGPECVIFQNVTLGAKKKEGRLMYPTLGRRVRIYPNAVVVGDAKLADGTVVGASCFLNTDTISDGVYAGVPGKLVNK